MSAYEEGIQELSNQPQPAEESLTGVVGHLEKIVTELEKKICVPVPQPPSNENGPMQTSKVRDLRTRVAKQVSRLRDLLVELPI